MPKPLRPSRPAAHRRTQALARGALLVAVALAISCKRAPAPAAGEQELLPYRQAHIDWRAAAGQELVLAMNQHMETDALRPQLARFEALTGVHARVESYPENELHQKTLVDLVSRKGGFDVIMMDFMFTPQYAKAGLIEPLDPLLGDGAQTDAAWLAASDFVPALLDAARYDDKLWALPFTSETTLLFYRKDLFAAAGLQPPDTFTDLAMAAKKLHHPPEVAGIGLRGARGQGMNVYVWTGFLRGFGGDFFERFPAPSPAELRPTLTSQAAVEATALYASLLKESGPRGAANWTWLETLSGMQEGRIAMCIDASNFGPAVDDPKKSATAGKWGVAAVPRGPGGRHPSIYTHTLAINAASRHKRAAWLFLQFATSREAQRERALETGEPTRTSLWQDPEIARRLERVGDGAWMKLSLASLAQAKADYRPRFPRWREVGDILGIAVQEVVAGEKDAAPALGAAQAEIEKALARPEGSPAGPGR
jgi:ABC-type glycerol-3-phosphate transport system substrate-binding protein